MPVKTIVVASLTVVGRPELSTTLTTTSNGLVLDE